jgi:ATP-dependent DNA helicase RecG
MSMAQDQAVRPGAGASLAERLGRLGLRRDWDFVLHLPLRYEDESVVVPIAALRGGLEAQVEGEIVAARVVERGRPQLQATLRDDSGELLLRWLHFYPSQRAQAAVGQRVRAYGAVRGGLGGVEMVHPRLRRAGNGATPLPAGLSPVYPTTEGLPQRWLRRRIARALRDVDLDAVEPSLPWLPRPDLPGAGAGDAPAAATEWPLGRALRYLHQPPADADAAALAAHTHPAWLRVKFDELLAQQIALRLARARRTGQAAPALGAAAADGGLPARLLAALPFRLTAAQQRVWDEVAADLARAEPMHRLVQGDVGSGKTVVAALAAARAIDCGFQAALMAPTEILAEQHFGRIAQWLAPLGVEVAWLAGRQKAPQRRAALEAAASGAAALVVGTHALIQQAVRFARLGLAIVDEQHRFGVVQRLALRRLAAVDPVAGAPHLLMLSATPIPRTLAMSYLADLDVSVIDALPPGRQPVVTKLLAQRRRELLIGAVAGQVALGRQVYWVCPLVEDDAAPPLEGEAQEPDPADPAPAADEGPPLAATVVIDELRAAMPQVRVGLLHGQLPPAAKATVMAAFAAGELDVLVATTVVEVGVDVTNATLMVVDHAQRFGLAQLHQLRGRVGRGAARSYCVLLYDEPLAPAARERLMILHGTTDGFEIARRDLALRGPGEFLGARQSGQPLLRYADLTQDAALVEHARATATVLLRDNPAAAQTHAHRWLAGREGFLGA